MELGLCLLNLEKLKEHASHFLSEQTFEQSLAEQNDLGFTLKLQDTKLLIFAGPWCRESKAVKGQVRIAGMIGPGFQDIAEIVADIEVKSVITKLQINPLL